MKNVYVGAGAPQELIALLREDGLSPAVLPENGEIAGTLSRHADLSVCRLGTDADSPLVFARRGELGADYPLCAGFCALAFGRYFVHNLKITAPRLLRAAEERGLTAVHVRQGFSRCSALAIGGGAVITADRGLLRALERLPGVETLAIREGHVLLDGYEYGFIGGAAGLVGDTVFFCGDLSFHPDGERIRAFIGSRGLKIRACGRPLRDIGGIIEGGPIFEKSAEGDFLRNGF